MLVWANYQGIFIEAVILKTNNKPAMQDSFVIWIHEHIARMRLGKNYNDRLFLHRNLLGSKHLDRASCPCGPFVFYVGDKRSDKEIAVAASKWFGTTPGETLN